ncbi:MAG TPA: VCBS repeat-containing protein, partial [Caldilineaceae bacterium]|nr:VCBS repeat-containing protein [Caldilineaceae bacterium]
EYTGIEQQPIPLVGIHVGAETEQDYIEYFLGSERQRETYTPLNDQWHRYRLEVDQDGLVHFYRDGELKFAPENPIDLDVFAVRPVVLEGRSYQTDMLIDDLAIYGAIVPAGPLELESQSPFFRNGRVLTDTVGFVRSPILPDLDGDGDPDIVLASVGASNRILAFENPGRMDGPTWQQATIGKSTAIILQLAALDFDSDGDTDLVSGGTTDEDFEIILWQNNGEPFAGGWSQIDVGTSQAEVQTVLAADLDGDGDPDLITGSGAADVELHLWENPGPLAGGQWSSYELGAADDSVLALELVDLDGDGDMDLISGGRRDEDYELIAWVNDGTPFDNPWQAMDIGDAPGDVYALALADVDGDGDLDLFSAGSRHGDPQIVLWQNDGTPLDGLWESSPVGILPANVQGLIAADVDKDGRIDLITSSGNFAQGPELIFWQSDDSPFAAPWTAHSIGETGQITRLAWVDLDGDGALDLVTGGESLLMVWAGVGP